MDSEIRAFGWYSSHLDGVGEIIILIRALS